MPTLFYGKADTVDYETVADTHFAVLRKAFAKFSQWYPDDYYHFCYEQGWWLEDYALFMTAKGLNGGVHYRQWPKDQRDHEKSAIDALYARHENEVHFWKFCQYEFQRQWRAMKEYAKNRACVFWEICPSMCRRIPPTCGPDRSCSSWKRTERPRRWPGARRIIFPRTASFGAIRCTTGIITARRGTSGGCAASASRWNCTTWCASITSEALTPTMPLPYGEKNRPGRYLAHRAGHGAVRQVEKQLGKADIVAEDLGEMFDSVRQLLKDSGFRA